MAETSRNPKSKISAMESVTEDPSQRLFYLKKGNMDTTKARQQIPEPRTTLRCGSVMDETSQNPESKISAMESVYEDPPQRLFYLKKGNMDTTRARQQIRSRATNLREKCRRLRRRGLSEAGQESLQLKEQKDFLTTHKLELDKKRLLVISEQKEHTSGSVLREERPDLWSENRLVALKRELLREETLLSKLEEKGLTSLEGSSKSDDNSSRYEILNALTELMQVQEDRPHFLFWHRIRDFSDCQSLVCYEILVYAETFLFLLESQVRKGKQAIKSTDKHSRVDSLRQVVDAQQELLNMQKMTYQKMTGTKQEKKTPGQGESEEGKKKLLQRMSVIKQEEGTLGQAETVEGIKQSADTSKQLELILEQTRVLTEIEREGFYHISTKEELVSIISATFETTFDAMLLLTNSSTLMVEHCMEIFEELFFHIEHMPVAIPDSFHFSRWMVNVNSTLMDALHLMVCEIRTTGELLQKFSVKKPPSQDQETELEEDGRTSILTSAEEMAKLQSQEQQDPDIGQETATKQSTHSDAATVIRFGAFGMIARQPNSMTLEVLACRDTEETIEEMFKYCQNNCLQILDFSGHQMKLDSPTDLCLVVKTLGKKWVLLDSTKQTVSKEQLTEGFFGKSKWQFQTKQDEEDARSPARDELLCEIEIKPNDESIAYSEVNTVQLSVDFASLVDFPTCESNPETVTYNKEDMPTQTHLDKLLRDYKELAEELGEEFIKENTMQLENFAIGYFNEEGGTLSLNSHKVQLYIPRGALPSDRKEQVYIYVDPSGQLEDGNDSLSPVVRCGPPGLKFTESVVLSFPHSAGSSADLSALICEGTKGCPNDWQPLEDALISFNGNKAILLVDHFTRFGVGYKSRKIHIAAASDYVPSSGGCTVRLCVFNKSPRDLDDFAGKTKKADLVRHKGHVYAGIRNVSNGYEVRPKARQVFHWQQVWTVFKNTTTFYLISSASTFSIPICEVNCSQEALHNNQPWKGFDVSMKVTPGSPPLSELNRVGNEDAPCPNKPTQLTVGAECSPSTRPSDQLTSSLLEEIKDPTSVPKPEQESMKRKFAKNVLGDYGGLSSTGVSELCELLEANREGESYWRALAKDLFGPSERLIKKAQLKPSPAKEVLKVYFATKIGDEDAVENLTHVFRRLGFDKDVIRSTEDADTVSENSENDASKGNVALPTESLSNAPFCAQSHSVPSRIRTDHEKILRHIASELGEEWERLATTLGVSSSKIFQLKENNRGRIGNAMFQMLLWWHQGGGQLADLVSALDDVGRNDLATELQGMIKSNPALQSSRCLQRSKYCKTFWDRMKPSQLLEREQCDNEVLSAQPAENQGTPQKHMSKTLRKDVTLSEDTKRKLCEELNNKSADKDWESLLSYLCDVGPVFLKDAREKLKDPASAVLNAYFSIRSKGEAANTIKLMYLKEVFNRLHMSNALQILNEDDAIRGLPGCLPSHLQKVLKEFYLLTAHISENNLLGKVFQLPNIAIGYFDSVGGSLLLEDYGVHLYVPGGALPSGRVQQVYIYVDPNASPMDDVKPPKIVLSRMIQCGPPQLAFKRNIVLSFPYQATEDVKWTLITQVCQNDNEGLRSWEDLEGDRVFLTKDEVIVLLDHFTGVRQTGMPNENVRCVGVYGPEIDERSRTFEFRVRVWKNEEEARKRVNDMEILKRSKLLDTERMLGFDPNKGDVVVDVTNISEPWQIEQSTENVITKEKVASFSENSVTFILGRTAPTSAFHCNVQVEQTGNGSRTTFVHSCHLAREGAGAPQDGVPCTCGTVDVYEMCRVCKEDMRKKLELKIIVKGILCSLPLKQLSQLLDNGTDNASNSQGLARYLMKKFELNDNSTNFSAEDLLVILFERCYKREYSSQKTVDLLIDALESIQNTEAVQIVKNYIRTEAMEI